MQDVLSVGGVRLYTFRPWYASHLAPIADLLPPLDIALCASYGDLVHARRAGERRIVLAQHGAGQSYSDDHAAYPGGEDNDDVGLFLTPNEHSAQRWRAAYPRARVEAVGNPRLDGLPRRPPGGRTVAFAWHWEARHHPEARSALDFYREALPAVAERFEVMGHGHPRRKDLDKVYAKAGIERASYEDVLERADVLVFDNTSVGYEFASTGRPVVVLNAPWYRKHVDHGLRFWDAATIGPQVDEPSQLLPAIEEALEYRPEAIPTRETALDLVYAYRSGAAARAARIIEEWASC